MRGREVLEGGQTSQKEIAESLGYKDVASFTRAFRKAVGLAPGAYRKRFGGKGISPADFPVQDGSRQKQQLFEPALIRAERAPSGGPISCDLWTGSHGGEDKTAHGPLETALGYSDDKAEGR